MNDEIEMVWKETLSVAFISNMNKIHIVTTYSFKIHANISLISTPKSSKLLFYLWVFRVKFCLHNFYSFEIYAYVVFIPALNYLCTE
jgi:hypothetical protein